MNDDKRAISSTTDGKPPRAGYENASAPAPVNPRTGQHEAYWVLSEEERAKGFVRPVRTSYRHVGRGPVCGKPRDGAPTTACVDSRGHEGDCTGWRAEVTDAERARLDRIGYLGGCDTVTTMGRALAETYARAPGFYGATFCVECGKHLPVGEGGEFVWVDGGGRVGT